MSERTARPSRFLLIALGAVLIVAVLFLNDVQSALAWLETNGRNPVGAVIALGLFVIGGLTGTMLATLGIDIHVHLQMPVGDFTSADDFYSGTRAAAFGGTGVRAVHGGGRAPRRGARKIYRG